MLTDPFCSSRAEIPACGQVDGPAESRRVDAGFHGSGGDQARRGGEETAQPGFGRAVSRWIAPVMTSVQGQWSANLRCLRRTVVMSWAVVEKRRSRSGDVAELITRRLATLAHSGLTALDEPTVRAVVRQAVSDVRHADRATASGSRARRAALHRR